MLGAGLLASFACAPIARAQAIAEEEMVDLGSLDGENSGAFGTNGDGSTVFGYAQLPDGTVRMVMWHNGTIRDITPDGALFFTNVLDRGGVRNFRMSRDGSTVTGYFVTAGAEHHAVIIRGDTVTEMTGAQQIVPRVVSGDGKIVGGTAIVAPGQVSAFYYDASGLHWLPSLERGLAGTPYVSGISRDGSVLVGSDVSGDQRAVRWVNGSIEDLGVLPDGINSRATDVSDDGNVVVGFSNVTFQPGAYQPRAFIWRDGQMTALGVLNNTGMAGNDQSAATAVSGDGTTVIGSARMANEAGQVASQGFVWRDGTMQHIGMVPTSHPQGSFATVSAVSYDGRAIAGQARSMAHPGGEAFRWYDGDITLLGTLGGDTSYSTDISDDGSMVVGVSANASGAWRAFIWRTAMQDYTNLLGSFGGLAEETELAMAVPRERLRRIERRGCTVREGGLCLGVAVHAARVGPDSPWGKPGERSVALSAGWRPHPLATFGATLVLADARLASPRSRMSDASAWSGWVRLADAARVAGPALEGWYARSHDTLALDRTAGIADVQPATGTARLRGESYGARLSYTMPLGEGWSLAPFAAIAQETVRRGPYDEQAADFPAQFDPVRQRSTRLSAGMGLTAPLGGGTLQLSGAVERDGGRAPVVLSGQSELPGAETFALPSSLERHRTRGRFLAGYAMPLGPVQVDLSLSAASPELGSRWLLGAGVGAGYSF